MFLSNVWKRIENINIGEIYCYVILKKKKVLESEDVTGKRKYM